MKPTRRTQPYRKKTARPAGATLAAMMKGEPVYGPHPKSSQRRLRKRRGKAVRSKRQNRGRGEY